MEGERKVEGGKEGGMEGGMKEGEKLRLTLLIKLKELSKPVILG